MKANCKEDCELRLSLTDAIQKLNSLVESNFAYSRESNEKGYYVMADRYFAKAAAYKEALIIVEGIKND